MSDKPTHDAATIAPAPASVKLSPEQRALVDEFGELDRKYRLVKPDLDRLEKIKPAVKALFSHLPGNQAATAEGNLYSLQVTACEMERTPDKRKIYKFLGPKLFLEFAGFTQTAFKTAVERLKRSDKPEDFFPAAQTGARKLTAIAKATPPATVKGKAA